ncbi:hypothetical protein ACFL3F_01730 [Planctomycetota bacterium]
MNALREQQLSLQKNIDFNTEMMASLLMEMDLEQQDMDSVLNSIQKKQYDLQSRQDDLQQYVDSVSTNAEEMTNQMQILSQELSRCTEQFAKEQQLIAANYQNLSDTQNNLHEVVYGLQDSCGIMQAKLVSLEAEQVLISELTSETKEELQELSASIDQRAKTAIATLIKANLEQLAADLQSMQVRQTENEQAVSEQSDAILRNLNELQANDIQWQSRLDALQQEIEFMRDSTINLDSKVTLLQEAIKED